MNNSISHDIAKPNTREDSDEKIYYNVGTILLFASLLIIYWLPAPWYFLSIITIIPCIAAAFAYWREVKQWITSQENQD